MFHSKYHQSLEMSIVCAFAANVRIKIKLSLRLLPYHWRILLSLFQSCLSIAQLGIAFIGSVLWLAYNIYDCYF